MDAHERFIRQHPDQWYMFREMWPRIPKHSRGPRVQLRSGGRAMTLRLSELHWLWIMGPSVRCFPRLYYALCIGIGWGLFHGFPELSPPRDAQHAAPLRWRPRACPQGRPEGLPMSAQYYVDLIAMPRRRHMEHFERDHLTVLNGEL